MEVNIELLWSGNRQWVARARSWDWAHHVAEGIAIACGWEIQGNHNYGGAFSYLVYDPFAEIEIEILLSPAE